MVTSDTATVYSCYCLSEPKVMQCQRRLSLSLISGLRNHFGEDWTLSLAICVLSPQPRPCYVVAVFVCELADTVHFLMICHRVITDSAERQYPPALQSVSLIEQH